MIRALAFMAALGAASLALSSACLSQPAGSIQFSLEEQGGSSRALHASFRREPGPRQHNEWSTGFLPSEMTGLDVASFHSPGRRPIRFAIVREAGRLDCLGTGGSSVAAGTCRFAENPAFQELLMRNGIDRPDSDQSFGLMAVNVRRELIESLAAAHYPAPHVNDLIGLAALGADGRFVSELARSGYRPASIQSLIEFKALGITSPWISGFVRIGYANVPPSDLVQMRALGITPDFIEGFQRAGYRHLPVSALVQLKALDITPAFVRSFAAAGEPLPPINKLVELKIFSARR